MTIMIQNYFFKAQCLHLASRTGTLERQQRTGNRSFFFFFLCTGPFVKAATRLLLNVGRSRRRVQLPSAWEVCLTWCWYKEQMHYLKPYDRWRLLPRCLFPLHSARHNHFFWSPSALSLPHLGIHKTHKLSGHSAITASYYQIEIAILVWYCCTSWFSPPLAHVTWFKVFSFEKAPIHCHV